jgi:hypothetical protein
MPGRKRDMSNVLVLRQYGGLGFQCPDQRAEIPVGSSSDVVSQAVLSIENRYNLRKRMKTSKCHSAYQITTTSNSAKDKRNRRQAVTKDRNCTRGKNLAKTKPYSDGKTTSQSETITGTKDEDGSECSRSTVRLPTEELEDTVKKIVADYHTNYKPWQERGRNPEKPFRLAAGT